MRTKKIDPIRMILAPDFGLLISFSGLFPRDGGGLGKRLFLKGRRGRWKRLGFLQVDRLGWSRWGLGRGNGFLNRRFFGSFVGQGPRGKRFDFLVYQGGGSLACSQGLEGR